MSSTDKIPNTNLRVVVDGKRLQCRHGDHPGRDVGAQVLGQEGTQRNVLPLLDIPRAPVVHQHHAENVLVGFFDRNGIAHLVPAPNEERHLEFEVKQLARAKDWGVRLDRAGLAVGPANRLTADHHGAGSAVVAHREVLPVGHEGVVLASVRRKFNRLG